MSREEYWREAVESSFEEHGIEASDAQIALVAADVAVAVEHQSLAFHTPARSDELRREADELRRELAAERAKVGCIKCGGRGGRWVSVGTAHRAWDECLACGGEGKVSP